MQSDGDALSDQPDQQTSGGPADTPQFIALAVVARPHGVRGELRLKLFNEDSNLLVRQKRIRLVVDGEASMVRIQSTRVVPGALLVRVEGVSDREHAERLRGATFEVPRSEFDDIDDDDEHYVVDLVGSKAMLGGEAIGVVIDVVSYPTCDALLVRLTPTLAAAGKKIEVPLQGAYVGEVGDGTVELISIDGLE